MGGGGRREVSILSHRRVTSSDLQQDRLFFLENVSTFFQLVVAPEKIACTRMQMLLRLRTSIGLLGISPLGEIPAGAIIIITIIKLVIVDTTAAPVLYIVGQ